MASYSDDFNRADDPDDLGANWTTAMGELNISGNQAVGVSGAGAACTGRYTAGAMDSANYYSQADVTDNGGYGMPTVRATSNGYHYGMEWDGTWSTHDLNKRTSGGLISMDSWADSGQGEPATIKTACDGSTIKGYVEGIERCSAIDTDLTAAGAPGLSINYDDRAIFDDWSAEDLAAGTTAYAFGEASPTQDETPESWATWSDGAGGSPTIVGDADWGQVSLAPGEVAHSAVKDLLNTDSKPIVVTRDRYGTGSGSIDTYIRGQATSFTQDAASPSWEAYSGQVSKTWQYVQIKIAYA